MPPWQIQNKALEIPESSLNPDLMSYRQSMINHADQLRTYLTKENKSKPVQENRKQQANGVHKPEEKEEPLVEVTIFNLPSCLPCSVHHLIDRWAQLHSSMMYAFYKSGQGIQMFKLVQLNIGHRLTLQHTHFGQQPFLLLRLSNTNLTVLSPSGETERTTEA